MQNRLCDLIRPKTWGKPLSRNGNSLQKGGLNRTGTGHILMTTTKELCLAIIKYFIGFGNKRFFLLVSSPPIKVFAFLGVDTQSVGTTFGMG